MISNICGGRPTALTYHVTEKGTLYDLSLKWTHKMNSGILL